MLKQQKEPAIMAQIKEGDRIPNAKVYIMDERGPKDISTEELFKDKKIVLFAVPGAFTPTCSQAHLPGYVVHADTIKSKGVDEIVCLSVNDAFAMAYWGNQKNASELLMVADGNADLTKAMGLEFDASGFGMGIRSQRYAMIVDNGVVTKLHVEPPREFGVSTAENILKSL